MVALLIQNQLIFQKLTSIIIIIKLLLFIQMVSHICPNQNIFTFNSKNYRAGHSAFNSNGDMIIEYSYQNERLFFGLKKNGKPYFKENGIDSFTKTLTIGNDANLNPRYYSRNVFVSLNSTNDNNDYLFSLGTYTSSTSETVTELYDIENNNIITKDTMKFLGNRLYSYTFSLYEIGNTKQYLIAYSSGSSSFINILSFSDFSLDNAIINTIEEGRATTNSRVINSFRMNDNIVLLYLYGNMFIKINIYDLNLNLIAREIKINNVGDMTEIFCKGLHLKDNLMAFMNFRSSLKSQLQLLIGYVQNNTDFILKISSTFYDYRFEYSDRINDFVKLSEERLAYFGKSDDKSLGIILIDIYNNVQNMKLRVFYFNFDGYEINTEFEAIIYNNYLAFTSTVQSSSIFSVFLIFGYANGTDGNIDIDKYFNDNIENNNNLVSDITNNVIIDNNIFGYEVIKDRIKLVYIPESLLFYNKVNENTLLTNEDILEKNYILKNNENANDNNNAYLEYQIMLSEPDYDSFNNQASSIINCSFDNNEFVDEREFYNKKIFYGRTNTLYFLANISCHEYCLTCNELGLSDNAQKCLSCKEQYNYFYPKNFSGNCVPEGKFYDSEANQLIECDNSNSKFYKDENGKIICFPKSQNCPDEYPYFIITTNECSNTLNQETTISTSLIKVNNCSKDDYIKEKCNVDLNDDKEAYDFMIDILSEYEPDEGKSIYLKTESNISYELTTSEKEKNELNGIVSKDNLTIIDIDQCEEILRHSYNLSENISLIFLKSENLNSIPSERNVQYEIYESLNKTKLNLSLCEGTDIHLYAPIELDNHTQQLYEHLQNSGYDLFNINDKFYQDICSPYKSENGTDIILTDRINEIYYKNNNLTVCQENCQYSEYVAETKLLKCSCNAITESIDYENKQKFTSKKIYESFYEVLKYSNYKIVKCYNLIMQKNPFSSNKGSNLIFTFFIIYLLFFLIFIFKGISSLKIDISKYLLSKQNHKPRDKIQSFNGLETRSKSFHKKREKAYNPLFPPKQKKIIRKNKKNKKNNTNTNTINNLSIVDNKVFIFNNSKTKTIGEFKKQNSKPSENKINDENKLDDFELNDLEYLEAKEKDKRSFLRMYWSILRREHRIIFTFYTKNDYNLIFIKFMRFMFLLATDMAMNVIFFSDESMHKVYLNYGKYDFYQQIPQSIYSLIVSQIIEVFICFLSLTDKHFYQIKNLSNNGNIEYNNKYKIFKAIRCIKLKLLGFFVFTFIFFGIYWYLIACFCAVYQNTQTIFIKDFLTSFVAGLIYPFILYIFPSVLRIIALRACKNNNLEFIYKISDIIPIF